MATLEEQIRELEARRAKGEVVPKLDALYKKQDDLTRKGYDSVVTPQSAPQPHRQPQKRSPLKPLPDYYRSEPSKKSEPSKGIKEMVPMEPRMRSMPQEETPKGIKEMDPMELRRPMGKPRSMNADRDKAYDTDVNLKKGGKVSSASKRADGCAIRGKTRA